MRRSTLLWEIAAEPGKIKPTSGLKLKKKKKGNRSSNFILSHKKRRGQSSSFLEEKGNAELPSAADSKPG